MRHFLRLPDFNILYLAQSVQYADELWDGDTIILREGGEPKPAWKELAHARGIVADIVRLAEATAVGDVSIERLPSGSGILMKGAGILRWEVVLHAADDRVRLTTGEETVTLEPGACWTWRIAAPKDEEDAGVIERYNGSDDDTVSMIIQLEKR